MAARPLAAVLIALVQLIILSPNPAFSQYEPTWDSLDTRPLPQWYDDAKFGIFMHWGLYSVPSIGNEWFWYNWEAGDPTATAYMQQNYKPNFEYQDFGPMFTSELFDEDEFARIVSAAGAKYFVLTSKHHEGYTMWPSNYSWNWNAWDVGPHRDLVGDLSRAIRAKDVRFGLYHSLVAWFHPIWLKDQLHGFTSQEYVANFVTPMLHELMDNYRPEIIWSDGDFDGSDVYWNSTEFIAWLYNESPVKDTVVTNDRWAAGWCNHGDFFTCSDNYNPGVLQSHKWENCMTVDSGSWGYRRDVTISDFRSIEDLIGSLVGTVSCGGNLLLNVGPTSYGKIIPIFEERLTQLGQWLQANGEGIYETRPWIYQNDTVTPNIWYTSKLRSTDNVPPHRLYNPQQQDNTVVYAFVLNWPDDNKLTLGAAKPTDQTTVSILGYDGEVKFDKSESGGLVVDFSGIQWTKLPTTWAWTLKLEYLQTELRTPLITARGMQKYKKH